MRCPWCRWILGKRQHLKVFLCYTILYLLTFGAVAPYFLSSWVYSFYFDEELYSKTAEAVLKKSNRQRLEEARQYLKDLDSEESKGFHQKQLNAEDLDVLVVVKTIDRTALNENPKMGYLTQTVVKLDREIRTQASGSLTAGLIVCNADPRPSQYEEAMSLAKFYLMVMFEPRSRNAVIRETEKQDYSRCLESALKISSQYVLMVEDDAEPYDNMLQQLGWIVHNHLETYLERGEKVPNMKSWAFLKLYYPERWSGYSNCLAHILELCGIGCLSGSIWALVVMLMCRTKVWSIGAVRIHFFLGAAYGFTLALLVGRQHLLQLRRLGSGFLTVGSAPGCCTPAMLFPQHVVGEIVRFLSSVTCNSDYGVDLALDDFAGNMSLHRYFVEPNLFHHRGVYSTLTKPKGMAEFLFDT